MELSNLRFLFNFGNLRHYGWNGLCLVMKINADNTQFNGISTVTEFWFCMFRSKGILKKKKKKKISSEKTL